MRERLGAGIYDRLAANGSRGHGGVVDQAVHHHLFHVRVNRHRVRGQLRQLPGQLLLPRQSVGALVGSDLVLDHGYLLPRTLFGSRGGPEVDRRVEVG